MNSAPLSGIRVLDFSRVLAGPWAAQLLGDLGAEVIKVERPGTGDDTRSWGPPYLQDADGDRLESAYFLSANRNKFSLTLDIGAEEGAAIARRLAASSDIFIENFKFGDLKKRGLDYESLNAANPGLIYCSITGFGQNGPYAERPGYDLLVQAMGGLMSITGPEPQHGGPQKVGVAITDISTGLYATVAILAALHARQKTGKGQYIDLALLDVQVATLANQSMNYLTSGLAPQRLGNAHPSIVPYQDFPTKDGHLIVAVGNEKQFGKFCEILGRPELASDSRFLTNSRRVENRTALVELIAARTRARNTGQWLAALAGSGVPSGPINTIADVFADPQIVARNMKIRLPDEEAGEVTLVANPIRLSDTPVSYRKAPPRLGADSGDVLTRVLGMERGEIDALARSGVI